MLKQNIIICKRKVTTNRCSCDAHHVECCYLLMCIITLILVGAAEGNPEVKSGPLTDGIPGKESPRSGRVSLSTSDYVICTGYWTDENARVYCKENSFTYGIALFYSVPPSISTNDTGQPSPKSIDCKGTESKLSECTVEDGSKCGDAYVGGVLCYNSKQFSPEVQLGGHREQLNVSHDDTSSMSGLVGLWLEGQVASVASEGWTHKESLVICKMFNYTRGRLITSDVPGDGPIMTGVNCTGEETSLFQCKFDRWQDSGGDHLKDVHVNCTYADKCKPPPDIDYAKLTLPTDRDFLDGEEVTYRCLPGYMVSGDSDSTSGKLVCNDGHWKGKNITCIKIQDGVVYFVDGLPGEQDRTGRVLVLENLKNASICPSDWTNISAEVVCREKHFLSGVAITMVPSNHQPVSYLSSTYNCTGTEKSLRTCAKTKRKTNCEASAVGGAICYSSPLYPPAVDIMGVNSSVTDSGLVVIMTSDQQIGICDNEWSDNEARVVCRMKGFRNGSKANYQVKGVGDYVYKSFTCIGNERSLLDCQTGGWIGAKECGGIEHYAHVKCRNKEPLKDYSINLSDGIPHQTQFTGRLLLAQNNLNKTICAKLLTEEVANVACRQLHLEGGIRYTVSFTGRTYSPFTGSLTCKGTEPSLDKCTFEASEQSCTVDGLTDGGILCYKSKDFKPRVGLKSYKGSNDSGLVTLRVNGVIGTVCNTTWSNQEAGVFCRELGQGFSYGEAADFGMIGINYGLRSIACTGNETSLFECELSGWVDQDNATQRCPSAQVKCLKPVPTTPKPTTTEKPTEKPTPTPKPTTAKPTTAKPTEAPPTPTPIPENSTTSDNDTGENTTTTGAPTTPTVIITTEWSNETETNTTSSGNSTGNQVNHDDDDSGGSSLAIPVSITCVVVVLLLVAGAFIYRRRRQQQLLMGYVRYNNDDITPSIPRPEAGTALMRDPTRGELDMSL